MADLSDFTNLEPAEAAKVVKKTSDADLAEMMSGDQRKAVLDTVFGRMPGTFRPERAGNTNAVVHWTITGAPDGGSDTYELVIADGACKLSDSPQAEPKVALTMSPVVFLKIVTGSGNPVMLFMSGKLKAKGDLGLASNIANLFDRPKV